jgi:hypothetical protein
MYNVNLENQLIDVNIVNLLQDYCSIQLDIDSTRVKASALVAQNIDLYRIMGKVNIDRVKEPQNAEDQALYELVVPAWCYYTYFRCLKMHIGAFTDSGFVVEKEALASKDLAKSVQNEMYSIAEVYMQHVVDFLDGETTSVQDIDQSKFTPQIRVFGGAENRASN